MTLPSHVNILTGLYPYQHGVRDNDGFRLADKVPTLATRLRASGYRTAAFIGAFPLDARFGLSKGFDVYDQNYARGAHAYDFVMPERRAPRSSRPRSRGSTRPGLRRRGSRFSCGSTSTIATLPTHRRRRSTGSMRTSPIYGEVASVDAALAPLFESLAREGKGRPTLLVLTADHGEALGDHGEATHGLFAYESTLHVPMVLWSPGHVAAGGDSALARHVDIVPTVLDAAHLPIPAELPGVSLLRERVPEVSYFESMSTTYNRGWAPLRGEIGGGYKYIDLADAGALRALRRSAGVEESLLRGIREAARRLGRSLPADCPLDPERSHLRGGGETGQSGISRRKRSREGALRARRRSEDAAARRPEASSRDRSLPARISSRRLGLSPSRSSASDRP